MHWWSNVTLKHCRPERVLNHKWNWYPHWSAWLSEHLLLGYNFDFLHIYKLISKTHNGHRSDQVLSLNLQAISIHDEKGKQLYTRTGTSRMNLSAYLWKVFGAEKEKLVWFLAHILAQKEALQQWAIWCFIVLNNRYLSFFGTSCHTKLVCFKIFGAGRTEIHPGGGGVHVMQGIQLIRSRPTAFRIFIK